MSKRKCVSYSAAFKLNIIKADVENDLKRAIINYLYSQEILHFTYNSMKKNKYLYFLTSNYFIIICMLFAMMLFCVGVLQNVNIQKDA